MDPVTTLTTLNQQFNTRPFAGDRPWWQTTVIYEIYPRSFQDSNGDGVGDLQGIRQRLPYLHALGVDAIWITPFFRSPMADFGYDISDYRDVDPIFGTMADFEDLLAAAHELGIRVLIDFVPNHTSDHHPWFIESRRSRDNPKRDWYIWRDGREDGRPPNNWETFFGGSAWTFDEKTEQYYLHMFLEEQPDLNWRNPEVVQAMHDVLHFWLQKGVDGFRLDAVTILIKNEALPDLPEDVGGLFGGDLLLRLGDVHNQPELHPILRRFRAIVDSYEGNRVLIGETGAADYEELMEFCGENLDEIHLPMNLRMPHPWTPKSIRQSVTDYYEALIPGAIPTFVFGNHDMSRIATRLGQAHHRGVAMLLLTLWGVPILYYGDELGMTDGLILPDQRQDPFAARESEFGLGRDPERTPMQWDNSPNAGFADEAIEPWLPVNTTFHSNVAEQEKDPSSTLNFCKALLHYRDQSTALKVGSIRFIESGADLLVYEREAGDERLLIVINFVGSSHLVDISPLANEVQLILSSKMDEPAIEDRSRVSVRPHEGLLLRVER